VKSICRKNEGSRVRESQRESSASKIPQDKIEPMNDNRNLEPGKSAVPPASRAGPAGQLRKLGWIILVSGVALGGLIYLLVPDDGSSEGDTLQSEYYKSQELETERLWGNGGSLILEVTRSFRRASTWSILIICLSAIVSLVCFFWAASPPRGCHGRLTTENAKNAKRMDL
jgi:hypothetical protein